MRKALLALGTLALVASAFTWQVSAQSTRYDLILRGGPQPFVDRRLEACGQLALDAHGAWPYPHFYCTKASGVRT